MADYASIEVELKGVKYATEATDSAGLLFLSILFNEDETTLIEQGRFEDAVVKYSDREASRMKHKIESAKTDEEKQKVMDLLEKEITMELWQRIERSNPTRSLITKRIKELFRFAAPNPIPDRQVFWYSDEDNGINLSASDLLALFSAIVEPTLADFKNKNKPAETALTIQQEPVAVVAETNVVRTDGLQEQRAAIAKLLDSNPDAAMRSMLQQQMDNLDRQLVS